MKPKTIAIIGGTGKMGTLFAKAFEDANIEVLITGRKTVISNIDATKKADIIIVTVPIRNTCEIIEKIAPFVRQDAMLTDFTSVKVKPCDSMQKNKKCEIVGGHPLFGPSAGFENQNFILCPIREGKYYTWYKEFLKSLGMNVIEKTPQEHDKNMAVIQCLTHFSNLSLGSTLERINFDLEIAKELSSPVYLMRVYGAGRILAQDETLYSDIQLENPYSKDMAKAYLESVKELYESVNNKDKKQFENIFIKSKNYFKDFLKISMEITDKMIKSMKKD